MSTPTRKRHASWIFSCTLVIACVMGSTAPASASEPSGVVQLAAGALVDTNRKEAYLMRPQGGIQAISLLTGSTLWKNSQADRPIASEGDVILAQVAKRQMSTLSLAFLGAATGDLERAFEIQLPQNTQVQVDDSLNGSFSIQTASPLSSSELFWHSKYQRAQGAQLGEEQSPDVRNSGYIRTDFGKKTARTIDKATTRKVAVDRNAPMPNGANTRRALFSENRLHVATSVPLENAKSGARYQWTVYSSNGKKLGSFVSAISFAPFVVVDDVLLYITPPREVRQQEETLYYPMSLRAVELKTGKQQYLKAMRDTRYQGPFPP